MGGGGGGKRVEASNTLKVCGPKKIKRGDSFHISSVGANKCRSAVSGARLRIYIQTARGAYGRDGFSFFSWEGKKMAFNTVISLR